MLAVRLCLLILSEAIPIKSHQNDCIKRMNKDKSRHDSMGGGSGRGIPGGLSDTQRTKGS